MAKDIQEALIQFTHSMLALGHAVSAVEVPRETFIDYVAHAHSLGFPQPSHSKVARIPRRNRSFALTLNQYPVAQHGRTDMVVLDRAIIDSGIVLQTASGPMVVRMPRDERAKMLEEYAL